MRLTVTTACKNLLLLLDSKFILHFKASDMHFLEEVCHCVSVSVSGQCGHADMTIVQILRLTDANALIVLAL